MSSCAGVGVYANARQPVARRQGDQEPFPLDDDVLEVRAGHGRQQRHQCAGQQQHQGDDAMALHHLRHAQALEHGAPVEWTGEVQVGVAAQREAGVGDPDFHQRHAIRPRQANRWRPPNLFTRATKSRPA